MTTDWNNTAEAQRAITEWADRQFPERKPQGVFTKLLEEVAELAASPGSALEFADLLILLYDYASMYDICIADALERKMGINRMRTWKFDEVTGLAKHTNRE